MACFPSFFRRNRTSPHRHAPEVDQDAEVYSSIQSTSCRIYHYKELCLATDDFSPKNVVGEGGFGSVYKGKLRDGTEVALKVLSAESRQGVLEFLTEINAIANIEHEYLVKLYGCCKEGGRTILVYEYLENDSLAQTLLGEGCNSGLQFDWLARRGICVGVAKGLAVTYHDFFFSFPSRTSTSHSSSMYPHICTARNTD